MRSENGRCVVSVGLVLLLAALEGCMGIKGYPGPKRPKSETTRIEWEEGITPVRIDGNALQLPEKKKEGYRDGPKRSARILAGQREIELVYEFTEYDKVLDQPVNTTYEVKAKVKCRFGCDGRYLLCLEKPAKGDPVLCLTRREGGKMIQVSEAVSEVLGKKELYVTKWNLGVRNYNSRGQLVQ